MELLTPDEFLERVGVRVPDSVIHNLQEVRTMKPENEKLLKEMARASFKAWWERNPEDDVPVPEMEEANFLDEYTALRAAFRVFMVEMEYKEPQEVCDIIMELAPEEE